MESDAQHFSEGGHSSSEWETWLAAAMSGAPADAGGTHSRGKPVCLHMQSPSLDFTYSMFN